jgi:hypothetical protein
MTLDQLRDHDAVGMARVEKCDIKRVQARITLTEAQAAMDHGCFHLPNSETFSESSMKIRYNSSLGADTQ